MYSKFQKLVEDYERDLAKDPTIRIVDRKVGTDFLNLGIPDDEDGSVGLTFGKPVKRFKNDKAKLERAIMQDLKERGKMFYPGTSNNQTFNKYATDLPKAFDWSDKDEAVYQQNLSAARRNNSRYAKSATFADCALASFIYTYINNKTTEQTRGELLDKYSLLSRLLDGKTLNSNELKYLTYSSQFLSRFLDKHVCHMSVQLTKSSIIEDIEMMIAEEIIAGYLQIRDFLKDSRNEYLQQKTKDYKLRAKNLSKQVYRRETTSSAQHEQNKQLTKIYTKMAKQRLSNPKLEKPQPREVRRRSFEVRTQMPKPTIERLYYDIVNENKTVKSSMHGNISIKDYRHTLHPPSKLIVSKPFDRTFIKETMKVDAHQVVNDVNLNYRLSKTRHARLIEEKKFITNYSLGPTRFQRPNLILAKKAVVTIERYWLSFKNRKEYRQKQLAKRQYYLEKAMEEKERELERKKHRYYVDTSDRSIKVEQQDEAKQAAANKEKLLSKLNPMMFQSSLQSMQSLSMIGRSIADISNVQPQEKPIHANTHLKQTSTDNQREIMTAVKNNNFRRIEIVLFKIYPDDVNTVDLLGNSPIFYAARHGNKAFCQFLIEKGAFINVVCMEANTPLHVAFLSGSRDTIDFLISKKANLNIINRYGQTPVAYGNKLLVKEMGLLNAIAHSDKPDVEFDNSPLYSKKGFEPIVMKASERKHLQTYREVHK